MPSSSAARSPRRTHPRVYVGVSVTSLTLKKKHIILYILWYVYVHGSPVSGPQPRHAESRRPYTPTPLHLFTRVRDHLVRLDVGTSGSNRSTSRTSIMTPETMSLRRRPATSLSASTPPAATSKCSDNTSEIREDTAISRSRYLRFDMVATDFRPSSVADIVASDRLNQLCGQLPLHGQHFDVAWIQLPRDLRGGHGRRQASRGGSRVKLFLSHVRKDLHCLM